MIAAPMFLVSGPDLVLACCRAGIVGSFPAPNARTVDILDDWMGRIAAGHAAMAAARPPYLGPWALNLVTHSSYERLPAELDLVSRHRPPLVITALGSPIPAIERVHAYGGKVFADVSTLAFARKAAAAGVDGLMLVSAGADLANVGTPFIVAEESMAQPRYKEMVTRASLEDLVLTKVFSGAEAYYMRESIVAAGFDPDNLQGKSKMDLAGTQDQVKAWKDIWSAGQGVDPVRTIEPVEAIVARYEAGYRAAVALPSFGAEA
jgi:nitronate monooxygenase